MDDDQDDDQKFEVCVICWGPTDVPVSMPVDLRYGYVKGSGQACRKCADQEQSE